MTAGPWQVGDNFTTYFAKYYGRLVYLLTYLIRVYDLLSKHPKKSCFSCAFLLRSIRLKPPSVIRLLHLLAFWFQPPGFIRFSLGFLSNRSQSCVSCISFRFVLKQSKKVLPLPQEANAWGVLA